MADEEPNIRWLFDDDPRAGPQGSISRPPIGLWHAARDDDQLPGPRDWLLGNTFARGFLSSLVAEGGTGKTSLRLAQCIAVATGRPLTGEKVFQRARTLYVSLEDDAPELRRRVRAALLHHNVKYSDLGDWLMLAAPAAEWNVKLPISSYTLAYSTRGGDLKIGDFLTDLHRAILTYSIQLVVIDPFVKLHSLNENSNQEIDFVCRVLVSLAMQYGIAIDVPHHTAKLLATEGGGNRSNRSRGASSFRDAVRLLYTLMPMTEVEAAELNVDERERRSLVRLDPGKLNITTAADKATWFKLASVNIGNGNETYPNGDDVQTVERWYAPDIWKLVSSDAANRMLDILETGLADGRKYSLIGNVVEECQAWRIVRHIAPDLTEPQAKLVLRKWQETGLIESADYTDPIARKTRKGVNVLRRPG